MVLVVSRMDFMKLCWPWGHGKFLRHRNPINFSFKWKKWKLEFEIVIWLQGLASITRHPGARHHEERRLSGQAGRQQTSSSAPITADLGADEPVKVWGINGATSFQAQGEAEATVAFVFIHFLPASLYRACGWLAALYLPASGPKCNIQRAPWEPDKVGMGLTNQMACKHGLRPKPVLSLKGSFGWPHMKKLPRHWRAIPSFGSFLRLPPPQPPVLSPRSKHGCIYIYYCLCKQECNAAGFSCSPRGLLNVITAKACHMSVMHCRPPLLTARWFSGGDDGLVPARSSWAGLCSLAACRINTVLLIHCSCIQGDLLFLCGT